MAALTRWTAVTAVLGLAVLAGCRSMNSFQTFEGGPKPADQVVRLQLPEEVDLLRVDGSAPVLNFTRLAGIPTVVQLLPGAHKIAVRYSIIWEISKDNHESIRSDAVMLDLDGQAGDIYTVKFVKPLRYREVKQFAHEPKFELVKN